MATIYVSYRSTEVQFVKAVMKLLEPHHQIRIDYNIPPGAQWREHQLEELRDAEVFLVFVSAETRGSDFQNSEIGSARLCSTSLDGKLIVPALIDDVDRARPLGDLEHLDLRHRDVQQAAKDIELAIARRRPRIRLFISHAHVDADLAGHLVDVITSGLEVPKGALRCTSVPGFKLDIGTLAPDVLRRELGSAACVIGLLTPQSIGNDWVLFELGAAWANVKLSVPLLAGGLENKDIPGPFRGAAGGQLGSRGTLDHLIEQLADALGWRQISDQTASRRREELVQAVAQRKFKGNDIESEIKASFVQKRARIGARQGQLVDHVARGLNGRPYIGYPELTRDLPDLAPSLHYRLEQLRLLGFLERVNVGQGKNGPEWGWTLSAQYLQELGR